MLAVLLVSYGSPTSVDEVEAYYAHILHGRRPPPDRLQDLKRRYLAIGGKSPLLEITQRQAKALEKRLAKNGIHSRVYVGMKHWHPFIEDIAQEIHRSGFGELVVIPLAPHSSVSTDGYREAVEKTCSELGAGIDLRFVGSWYLNPYLLKTWQTLIDDALTEYNDRSSVYLLFTAHSIPERYVRAGDPYERQFFETASELAKRLSVKNWGLAYQSASQTGEPWLSPGLLEKMTELARNGVRDVLVAPIGFVAEHLEILYDIDIQAATLAQSLGLRFKRTKMPNDAETIVTALALLVKQML